MSCGCHPNHDYKCACGADVDYHLIVYNDPSTFLKHICKACFESRTDRNTLRYILDRR